MEMEEPPLTVIFLDFLVNKIVDSIASITSDSTYRASGGEESSDATVHFGLLPDLFQPAVG